LTPAVEFAFLTKFYGPLQHDFARKPNRRAVNRLLHHHHFGGKHKRISGFFFCPATALESERFLEYFLQINDARPIMEVSLDQAIEIHAKVLKYRSGRHAARKARERAEQLALAGDLEGHLIWIRVGETVETLIRDEGQA
jgi:hypothetical protein